MSERAASRSTRSAATRCSQRAAETLRRRTGDAMSQRWSARDHRTLEPVGVAQDDARSSACHFMHHGRKAITKSGRRGVGRASGERHPGDACFHPPYHGKISHRTACPGMGRGNRHRSATWRDRFTWQKRFVVGGVPPAPTPLTTHSRPSEIVRCDRCDGDRHTLVARAPHRTFGRGDSLGTAFDAGTFHARAGELPGSRLAVQRSSGASFRVASQAIATAPRVFAEVQ
jgi:hypothetical protein